jgi:pimeloyl-ACP methyl ester carboxylesterase
VITEHIDNRPLPWFWLGGADELTDGNALQPVDTSGSAKLCQDRIDLSDFRVHGLKQKDSVRKLGQAHHRKKDVEQRLTDSALRVFAQRGFSQASMSAIARQANVSTGNMEEFFGWASRFNVIGCDVILFEGPGQGAALRRSGLTMPIEWEGPVSAVLDHFSITRCSLMGISLGGYLAPRAAAFEPRIKRVIAHNVLADFYACFASKGGEHVFRAFDRLAFDGRTDEADCILERLIASSESTAWAIKHGMHISGSGTPSEYLAWLRELSTAAFSPRITQDVLLTAGTEDHIVPLQQFFEQGQTLINARSLTMRLFTAREGAQAHCQVGNIDLLLSYVCDWLDLQLRNELTS